jgi:4-amino-4-deoxy-L-arabinose transferase-like glycosyltransferase
LTAVHQRTRFALLRTPSRRLVDLAVLGALAFTLRALWVLVYGRVAATQIDTAFYQLAASGLAHRGTYDSPSLEPVPTAGWPPGFPFAMSLLYRLFGDHLKLVFGLNVALATATVLLVYLIADRILGRRAGRVAGGFYAILPGPIFFTGLYLSDTLAAFIVVAIVALVTFLPDRRWTPALLGLALGLAALTRAEGLLVAAVPLVAWWGLYARREWARRALLLLAVMAITIAPWTIRNAIVMDAFIPVADNASWTLWAGHNPRANGGPVYPRDPELSGPFGTRGEETRRAQELRRRAIRWAFDHPAKELGLIPRKLLMLNEGPSRVFNAWINQGPTQYWQLGTSSLLVFTVLGDGLSHFLLLATLASLLLLGGTLWRTEPVLRGVFVYLALSLVAFGLVYYGQSRYRIPMESMMVLIATPLLVAVWEERRGLASWVTRASGGVDAGRPSRPDQRLSPGPGR